MIAPRSPVPPFPRSPVPPFPRSPVPPFPRSPAATVADISAAVAASPALAFAGNQQGVIRIGAAAPVDAAKYGRRLEVDAVPLASLQRWRPWQAKKEVGGDNESGPRTGKRRGALADRSPDRRDAGGGSSEKDGKQKARHRMGDGLKERTNESAKQAALLD